MVSSGPPHRGLMDKYIIPNLRNACRVLKLLSRERSGKTLAAVTRELEIPRTTALRILTTLHAEDMVSLVGKDYVLGTALIQLGIRALESVDVRTVAIPVLQDLSSETRETSHLAVLSGDRALLLEVCDSPHPVRVASRPGTLTDVHCSATGKVFLAYQVTDLREFLNGKPLASRAPNTLTTVEELEREVLAIRDRGYAVDEEEYAEGVRCLAAPVRNSYGEVVAAVGITASTASFTRRRIKSVAGTVMGAADRISTALGA